MTTRRGHSFSVQVAVLLLSGTISLFGSPVGSISGVVKDSTSAVATEVRLTLTNLSTNARTTIISNASGEFQFLQLPPATYSLAAELTGFKIATVPSVLVQVDQVTHVEITMEVGNPTETVQVEAVAPLLENDKSTISSVVDTRAIANMPLNARQYLDLALLTPGALPSQPGQQGGSGKRYAHDLYLERG